MRILKLLTALILASSAMAATEIPLGAFRSIELSGGGRVTVRYGAVQRVSMIQGDPRYTRVRVEDAQRLVIESPGLDSPRGYRLEIEVVTPQLSAVSVSNGGTLQSAGTFPAQTAIAAAVEQGGTIDIRSIPADRVNASIDSGGRIFTTSRKTLAASVASGGNVTYWGRPDSVKESIRDGGVVERGAPGDADQPLSHFGADIPAIPPIPAIPATPPTHQ